MSFCRSSFAEYNKMSVVCILARALLDSHQKSKIINQKF